MLAAGVREASGPAVSDTTVIAVEPADQTEVRALLSQSDAYYAAVYPPESNHLVDVATLA